MTLLLRHLCPPFYELWETEATTPALSTGKRREPSSTRREDQKKKEKESIILVDPCGLHVVSRA